MNGYCKSSLALLLLLCFLLCSFPAFADDSSQVVRVGFYPLAGLQNVDENGQPSGYLYDYLMEIAQYTDWKYDFYIGGLEECLQMLEKGELDLMGGIRRTTARMKLFEFSNYDCGQMDINLYIKSNDERYAYDDTAALHGMRVGIERGSALMTDLMHYCQLNSISVSTAEYDSQDALFTALCSGEVDGVCVSSSIDDSRIRCVAAFAPRAFYFISPKGCTDLIRQVDKVLETIKISKPTFEQALRTKHFPAIPGNSPMFTRAELDYIATADTLNVAYMDGGYPLEYTDENTGDFAGVHAEILEQVSSLSGLRFNYIPVPNRTDIPMEQDEQTISLLASVPDNANPTPPNGLRLTQSYLTIPLVMIARNMHPDEQIKVAMPRDTYILHLIQDTFPDYAIEGYDTSDACVAAVRSGKATATFLSEYLAREHLQDSRNASLTATAMNSLTLNYCIGVSTKADPLLVSILDKTLSCIDDAEVQDYLIANTLIHRHENLVDLFIRNPALWSMILVASVAVLFLLTSINTLNKNRHAKELYRIANIDALTGAPSAYCFHREASQLLRTVGGIPYVFLYMNIRKFKDINSLYGYSLGDDVLRCLNNTLHDVCDENERYGRIYADRFVLLLKYTGEKELFERFNQLNRRVADACHTQHGLANLCLVGGAAPILDDDKDIHAVIDRANYACQQAEADSRQDFVMFSNTLAFKISLQRTLEKDMAGALEAGEFLVYYQPKINSDSDQITGAEALIRWQHSALGLLPPIEFISLFEKNAFILKTDLYVFEQVCAYQANRQQRGKPLYPISCNFSRLHLANPAFVETLEALADRYNVAHSLLEVEITETVAMEDTERAQVLLFKLAEAGFPISIDDFGSGYSSLGLLSELDFDIVKIDRSLTMGVFTSPNRAILLSGLVRILNAMDKRVVCEGVETKEQMEQLRSLGCRIIQGYYYSRPLPDKDFDQKY